MVDFKGAYEGTAYFPMVKVKSQDTSLMSIKRKA